jgi:hypothetical protein
MDIDYFFYYGDIDLYDEVQADIEQGIVQDKRSMYYFRDYGAGLYQYENESFSNLATAVAMRYEIASWIARRNQSVSSGAGGTRDRRAVTSQTVIKTNTGKDSTDVSVPYVLLSDTQSVKTVSFSLKG